MFKSKNMYTVFSGVRERERSLLMATGDARPRSKKRKPRQEISAFLKWTVFLINFLVFVSLFLFMRASAHLIKVITTSCLQHRIRLMKAARDHLLRRKLSAAPKNSAFHSWMP